MVNTKYPSLECADCGENVVATWPLTEDGELKDKLLHLECGCLTVKIDKGVAVPRRWRRSPDGSQDHIE